MTKKPIIDQDMYILLLKAQNTITKEIDTIQTSCFRLEILLEDIDIKLSEYDTTDPQDSDAQWGSGRTSYAPLPTMWMGVVRQRGQHEAGQVRPLQESTMEQGGTC